MIFIDFEGFKNKPPSLVGYKFKRDFKQIILDPELKEICLDQKMEYLSFENFCEFIVNLSKESGCDLVAYTELEKDTIERIIKEDFHYIDVHKLIKKKVKAEHQKEHEDMDEYWYGQKKTKDGRPNSTYQSGYNKKRWKLSTMLKLFRYPEFNPKTYGEGLTTKRLRAVIQALNTTRGTLTGVQKGKITKLRKHNRIDVEGIEFLYKQL
jgi:hypothetical protein